MEPIWGTTDVSSKLEECTSSQERDLRSAALEKTYVHDVYQQIACHFTDTRHRAWPRVKQFLLDLEPGSIVCDVGCGNGKHLDINPYLYKIGIDRCSNLANAARDKAHEVIVSDNLALPFRDECVDAVLSVAVIHHFATADRRIEALRELARVLRIGGKILVSVWAMEQRHRKFESQDVLVPWNRPVMSSSDDKTSSIERDLNSTTTTSDDDATHYHAYTQTSDSDSFPSLSRDFRKRVRLRHRGKSIDPTCSSQSSSDLSSPNESCYTFVRRALQKLARSKRNRGGRRPWFLQGLDLADQDDIIEPLASMDEDVGEDLKNGRNSRPIDSSDFTEFLRLGESNSIAQRSLIFSNLLSTRRRRTLETTRELQHPTSDQISAQPKSKSLSDLLGLIPIGFFRPIRTQSPEKPKTRQELFVVKGPSDEKSQSTSSLVKLEFDLSHDELEFPEYVSHKAVQTDSFESTGLTFNGSFESRGNISLLGHLKVTTTTSTTSPEIHGSKPSTSRPTLVKQKHSVTSPLQPFESTFDLDKDRRDTSPLDKSQKNSTKPEVSWGDIKTSVRNLPEFKIPTVSEFPKPASSLRVTLTGSSIWKQTSLNEDLIFSERIREKERLKQNIQKQCSLNEEFINKERENTRWDQMKEAFLNPSNVKCIQILKNGISNRLRGYETPLNGGTPIGPPPVTKPVSQANSIKNGLVRMLQNWNKGEPSTNDASQSVISGVGSVCLGRREGTARRGLFPPFFLRRSSAGSLNVTKKQDLNETSSLKLLSPPPYLTRRPSENELVHDCRTGNKLVPGVRHVRKLSGGREDGSDSSKDSSFQSDTSVDSEDSFASVIFIPKGTESGGNDSCFFNSETRANSTDSDRSPKSPALRLSPPNHSSTPKSPSPLATEMRRRSPEVSPTRIGIFSTGPEKVAKFVFDEYATQSLDNINFSTDQSDAVRTLPDVSVSVEAVQETTTSEIILPPPPPIISIFTEVREVAETCRVHSDLEISTSEKQIQQEVLPRKKTEKIDVLRKPVNLPKNKAEITRKLVRRSLPKALAVELYNPETDDADTSDSSSSSPNSVSSVVSVVNEESVTMKRENEEQVTVENYREEQTSQNLKHEISVIELKGTRVEPEEILLVPPELIKSEEPIATLSGSRESSLEGDYGLIGSSSDSLGSHSSPKANRKLALARLGNTTDWLSSMSCDMGPGTSCQSVLSKRSSFERRHPGKKMLLGEVNKFQQKGPDAKWPTCIIDESPPQTAKEKFEEEERMSQIFPSSFDSVGTMSVLTTPADMAERLLEEMEEKDSLFDSIENLTSRQQPSRNPSIDSSLRMSSTCSCSIRGGDSFESYCSSAKSSLTNSSSNHYKIGVPSSSIPTSQVAKFGSLPNTSRRRRPESSKSSSAAGEGPDESSSALTYHRYYHVFREGELDRLIEKYVQNLHIISSYYDHANWCIIAEKVQVWTI